MTRFFPRGLSRFSLRILLPFVGIIAANAVQAQDSAPSLPGPPSGPAPQSEALQTPGTPVPINTADLVLDPGDPDRDTVGQLRFAGGVEVVSVDPYVGGISGLAVDAEGTRFLAISDRGTWFGGRLTYKDGRLAGLRNVQRAPMQDWRGEGLSIGDNDSEGLAIAGDEVVVSFEGFHRLWRYSLPDPAYFETVFRQTALALPKFDGLSDQPSNGGIEAVAPLSGGRFLAFSEKARNDAGQGRAWRIDGEEATELAWPVSDEFKPTDAATLDNGDVVVLERRFSLVGGVAARLRRVPAESIEAGGVLEAETLAVLEAPLTVDNMEGLAAVRDGNAYRFFLVSDDNFNVLQRTIVMSFVWRPESRTANK